MGSHLLNKSLGERNDYDRNIRVIEEGESRNYGMRTTIKDSKIYITQQSWSIYCTSNKFVKKSKII